MKTNAKSLIRNLTITGKYILEAAEGVCDYIDFSRFVSQNPHISAANIDKAEHIAKLYRGAYLQSEDYLWAEEKRHIHGLLPENMLTENTV